MTSMEKTETDLVEKAQEIIETAAKRDVPLRLVGSIGFRLVTDRPELHAETFDREIGDIDLVGLSRDSEAIQELFKEEGYEIDKDLLMAGWGDRYVFYGPDHEVDVFLDKLNMCHEIGLKDRLTDGSNPYALPSADLLLEKAQIVEINEKDLKDLALILLEEPLTADDNGINEKYIADLLASDWGFYHTVTTNLRKLRDYLDRAPLTEEQQKTVEDQIESLLATIENESKSLSWKARAKVGERVKWYNDVEEKHR